jgi:hypothetical protein
MAKLSQRQLAALRATFIKQREELLKQKVNSLQRKLYDMVFEKYLVVLEQRDGKLINSPQNVNIIQGLDNIYKIFRDTFNAPVVGKFIEDMNGINANNEKYFKHIAQKDIRTTTEKAQAAMNRSLGLETDGRVKQNGFTDKFLRDESVNKKIKKLTMQSITKGVGFQEFRQQLKTLVVGIPNKTDTGALQKYYRNYAYDTYQKVDNLTSNVFAKNIGLRYFIYNGGIIKTSREFCKHYNGTIVDSIAFSQLEKDKLPVEQQNGIPDDWTPLIDLGGYGCRHRKDWITDDIALRNVNKFAEKAAARRLQLENE